jgi:hypothetical protein
MPLGGVPESVARDARARGPAGDFHAGHHARHNFVLDPAVKPFGVLPDDDHIHAFIAGLDPGKISHRPHGRVEIQLLPQAAR